jgi:Tfp pilus assembly pilus retraction ATPase PilT
MQTLLIRIDGKAFIQGHWEIWAKTFPGCNINQLTSQQKQVIHERINREFGLEPEESHRFRQMLLNSPDSVALILPFVDSSVSATVNGSAGSSTVLKPDTPA